MNLFGELSVYNNWFIFDLREGWESEKFPIDYLGDQLKEHLLASADKNEHHCHFARAPLGVLPTILRTFDFKERSFYLLVDHFGYRLREGMRFFENTISEDSQLKGLSIQELRTNPLFANLPHYFLDPFSGQIKQTF